MTGVKWTMVVYGVALILMGVQAAFFPLEGSKASIVSLAAAGGMGVVVLLMTWLSFKNPRPAYIITLVIGVMAILRFLPKAIEGSVYPALVTVILSLVTGGVLLAGHFQAMAARKREADGPQS